MTGAEPGASTPAVAEPVVGRHRLGSPQRSSLSSIAARGASVTIGGQLIRIVLQIGSVAVLARLLNAVDYGLFAIVLAIVGVGEIIRDAGLSTAAVRAKELTDRQRDKLFWLNTAIGAALTVAAFLAAPAVAALFSRPELTGMTRALSATFLLNGMGAQYRAGLNRSLRFAAMTGTDIAAQLVAAGVAIAMAAAGAGYWSLVGQQVAQTVITLLLLVAFGRWLPGRPRRGVDVSGMLRYGRGLMASQVIGYLDSNVDTYTIGLRYGAAPLGVYNRGYQLLMRPLTQLRAPSTTVALPVLSRVDDDERAGRYVVAGQLVFGYTLVPALVLAVAAATPIVAIFLGPGWAQVVPVFSLLAVAATFQTLAYVGGWVYLSRGLTGALLRYTLVSLGIKVVCVLIGSAWGIVGVAAGFAVAFAVEWQVSFWWLARLTPLPLRQLRLGGFRLIGCALVVGVPCRLLLDHVRFWGSAWVALVVAAVAVSAGYALLAVLLPRVRADITVVVSVARRALHR